MFQTQPRERCLTQLFYAALVATMCSCHSAGEKGRLVLYRNIFVVMVLVGLWHGANWTFVAWGAYHGLLLIGYRLFDRATVGTAIDKVMKKRWFVPFGAGSMFATFVLSAVFFRPPALMC
jgi:D-alanyl-lipoteichoic acid acyltransferase DltB (MBOAT superfamily)